MQRLVHEQILYSPTDLVTFLACHHASFFDHRALFEKMEVSEDSSTNKLLQKRGFEHEAEYLQQLKHEGKRVIEIPKGPPLQERATLTIDAMRDGADVVYQGVLFSAPWRGDADFLIRCDSPSDLGDYSYEVLDTKLARHAEPKHIIQICLYTELLSGVQGLTPVNMHLVLGTKVLETFRVAEFSSYYRHARDRFLRFMEQLPTTFDAEPCPHCSFCHWKDRCEEEWESGDHLSLVANMQRSQEDKLREAKIFTVADLASAPESKHIPGMSDDAYQRLHSQASLQQHKKLTDEDIYTMLPQLPEKGFERLPLPDKGDLFFDMEGDPLYPDGLEYLFGVYFMEKDTPLYRPFWAHSHEEEKKTFGEFMEFISGHLLRHPKAHIYHYNHYETTALKRLSCRYALHEELLDNLLRRQVFVDLYLVVREAIRTSQPGYSIKNLEAFYMDKRKEAVATAAESIVVYNEWRETGDDTLLRQIADYNEVDCVSTHLLREWLVRIRPEKTLWYEEEQGTDQTVDTERKDWEIEYEKYRSLLEHKPHPSPVNQHLSNLLEFHNREAKPVWWNSFNRQTKNLDELIEDTECLASLSESASPVPEAQSLIYTYSFPPQEYKLRPGDQVAEISTLENAGTIVSIDEEKLVVRIKRGMKRPLLPKSLSIGPAGPVNAKIIRRAIYEYADKILEDPGIPRSATDILSRSAPRITGKALGKAIISSDDILREASKAVAALDNSYLFIQGPPGAGKTYSSSHIIVDLLEQGKKIGVASNSHKAVHNLLEKVEEMALERHVRFSGVKKGTKDKEETLFKGNFISPVTEIGLMPTNADLFAGTAWTFSDPRLRGLLDYLFIDEAGQVSTANVVAMATAAKNIILVGDQMQLGQPIQGIHPGDAGLSVLEFLLGNQATIPPDRGIFLAQTRRMHPTICSFISDTFYDGRLQPHESTVQRHLDLHNVHLPNEGIVVVPADHDGCSQKSEEEGIIIAETFRSLLGQTFIDSDGKKKTITADDILVVTPYNVQVNHLRSVLPSHARVGTVDKFQGQEAPIVLISMTTSSWEYLPRNIEFLYSGNRLNVAVSRAQCLAVVVANPRLLETPCSTIAQMKLVNTFCKLFEYAG